MPTRLTLANGMASLKSLSMLSLSIALSLFRQQLPLLFSNDVNQANHRKSCADNTFLHFGRHFKAECRCQRSQPSPRRRLAQSFKDVAHRLKCYSSLESSSTIRSILSSFFRTAFSRLHAAARVSDVIICRYVSSSTYRPRATNHRVHARLTSRNGLGALFRSSPIPGWFDRVPFLMFEAPIPALASRSLCAAEQPGPVLRAVYQGSSRAAAACRIAWCRPDSS